MPPMWLLPKPICSLAELAKNTKDMETTYAIPC